MSLPLRVLIEREADAADICLPHYATEGSAGMDLRAAIGEDIVLLPGARVKIGTGIRIALPDGYEAQVRPRSGLAWRHGIGMVNAPGTIDSDYRGIISVLLVNWGDAAVTIRRGDRIAQLVVAPIVRIAWQENADQPLPETGRQEGGFGHTDVG